MGMLNYHPGSSPNPIMPGEPGNEKQAFSPGAPLRNFLPTQRNWNILGKKKWYESPIKTSLVHENWEGRRDVQESGGV